MFSMKLSLSRTLPLFLIALLFLAGINQPEKEEIVAFGVVKYKNQKMGGVAIKVFENNNEIYSNNHLWFVSVTSKQPSPSVSVSN